MRPSWVILAKTSRRTVVDLLNKAWRNTVEDRLADDSVAIVTGTKGYLAIADYTPGNAFGGEKFAKALSRTHRVYKLECDPDGSTATTWDKGKQSGDLFESMESIVSTLGCKVPGLDPTRTKANLTPVNPPKRKKNEWTFADRTVGEWRHLMRMYDWSVMLDGTPCAELLLGLRHADATIRTLCIELAGAAGIHNLGEATEPVADQLMEMTDDGARAAGERLLNTFAREKVLLRHPWLLNFSTKHCAKGLALLDEPDPIVHDEVLSWFSRAYNITPKQRIAALARLRKLPKSESRDDTIKSLTRRK
jgi:hypothetical protein